MVDLVTKTSFFFFLVSSLVLKLHVLVIHFQMYQFWLDTLKDWKKMDDFSETHFMKMKSLKLLIAVTQLSSSELSQKCSLFSILTHSWTCKTDFTYSDKLVIPLFFTFLSPTPLLIVRHSVASPNPAFHNYNNR